MRVALVTGAASGIGRAVAARLAADGLTVVGADLAEAEPPPGGSAVRCDLTTRDGNRAAVDAALERHGRLDVVVANAGVQHVAPIRAFPEDEWDRLLALMLTSPFLLARYAWDALAASGRGRFVAIASAHGLAASPDKSAYVSAKHGVIGLVRTIALEGAAAGIQSVAICPCYVRTPLVERQVAARAAEHGLTEDEALRDRILGPQAVKRLVEPDEVAGVVSFVCGPGGDAISGSPLIMDLGWTA